MSIIHCTFSDGKHLLFSSIDADVISISSFYYIYMYSANCRTTGHPTYFPFSSSLLFFLKETLSPKGYFGGAFLFLHVVGSAFSPDSPGSLYFHLEFSSSFHSTVDPNVIICRPNQTEKEYQGKLYMLIMLCLSFSGGKINNS